MNLLIGNNNQHLWEAEYNCFTFALNIPNGEWGRPYSKSTDRIISEAFENEETEVYDIEEFLVQKAEEFLKNKYNIRVLDIKNIGSVDFEKEEIIQYRVGYEQLSDQNMGRFGLGYDFDFHFKVLRNGQWQEKNGGLPIHDCRPWFDSCGFVGVSDRKYKSRTLTFAHEILKPREFAKIRRLCYDINIGLKKWKNSSHSLRGRIYA